MATKKTEAKAEWSDSFIADAPVEDPSHDRFKRWSFAERIAGTIASRSDPSSIVVAIYGAWGEGKTTVLNFIHKALAKEKNTICIHFNPWRYSDETQLVVNFFRILAESLQESLSSKTEKVGELLDKYASIVSPLSLGFGGVQLSPGEAAQKVGKAMASTNLAELKRRLEKILSACNKITCTM